MKMRVVFDKTRDQFLDHKCNLLCNFHTFSSHLYIIEAYRQVSMSILGPSHIIFIWLRIHGRLPTKKLRCPIVNSLAIVCKSVSYMT